MHNNKDQLFDSLVAKAIDNIPSPYIEKIKNLHFKIEDMPTNEQREKLGLRTCDARLSSHKPRLAAGSSRRDAEDSFSGEGVPKLALDNTSFSPELSIGDSEDVLSDKDEAVASLRSEKLILDSDGSSEGTGILSKASNCTAKSETELMESSGGSDLTRIWCEPGLYGLYEGVPLTKRGGAVHSIVPDVITIFRHPMVDLSPDDAMLAKQINETVWHEVAHYFGLDHDQIHKAKKTS